jgi:putative CocE/NonD family hydrolase
MTGTAWHIQPARYTEDRPVEWRVPAKPQSLYLPMRDGCRLAIDVYLPQSIGANAPASQFPTILFFTPYYRRFKLREGATGENNPNTGKFRDFFVPRGYAVAVIDVRGTGASYGTRDSFRSPKERDDSYEVADWITRQSWSNGICGATGISYLGAAATFVASTGHPSVKAIAPISGVWDNYTDHFYPGGVHLNKQTQDYGDLMIALDHDRRDLLAQYPYFANPDFEGPQPVDDDPTGAAVRDAVHQHLSNIRAVDFVREFQFRDEGLPYDPSFSSASFSPYAVADQIAPDVAILSISGWMDGAGFTNSSIARFLALRDNPSYLTIGPWDHGGRVDVSPWRTTEQGDTALIFGEILRFFDHYLMGYATGLEAEEPVHYYSIHAQQWKASGGWPPANAPTELYLGEAGRLDKTAGAPGTDQYQIDFSLGTGTQTRYERMTAGDPRTYYPDWQGRTAAMLSFTSSPLEAQAELVGHAQAELWLMSSEPDAALLVYLTEIEADGTERYVTEGLLRALHRREAQAPEGYGSTWLYRTFHRDDLELLTPGKAELIRIPLLPIAWQFAAGSRIRLSITGSDADHCVQVPHGRPPRLSILHGTGHASRLILPVALPGEVA